MRRGESAGEAVGAGLELFLQRERLGSDHCLVALFLYCRMCCGDVRKPKYTEQNGKYLWARMHCDSAIPCSSNRMPTRLCAKVGQRPFFLRLFPLNYCVNPGPSLGACRVMGDRNEGVGERGQFFSDLRRIVDLCNKNRGEIGPLSHFRSRFIHNPTGSLSAGNCNRGGSAAPLLSVEVT